ncbi:MAG: alpha/beta family hydrolase [Nitriliruptorales bacterium]|nr:alpha/beta family hydrolase [Nitriliruptorales bacterium]
MRVDREDTRLPVTEGAVDDVRAVVHRPSRPRGAAFLLTHGAGGDLDSAPLVALADAIAELGQLVVRANLPYREAGRKAPPRADRAVAGFRSLADSARRELGPRRPWVFGGKSYGGRVASLAVADGLDAAGLLFYGYPLHPPGKPARLRVDHWPDIDVPCLFLQGTRDPFATLDLLDRHLTKLPRRARLHVVDGGDHSLHISKRASEDDQVHRAEEVTARLGPVVKEWLGSLD